MIKVYTKQILPQSEPVLHIFWHAILKRKIMLFSLLFLIISLPILYLLIKYQPKIEAAWMDDSFTYRQRVDITNAGTAQTDFQVTITLNTSALISAGKMQSDCDDIRITDVNGKVLPIWIETGTNACNTTTTAIWTKVPAISTTGTTVFLYYGNSSTTNTQNGDNVFEFFDDFSDNNINTQKWTVNDQTGALTTTETTSVLRRSGTTSLADKWSQISSTISLDNFRITDFQTRVNSHPSGEGVMSVYGGTYLRESNGGSGWKWQYYTTGWFDVGNSAVVNGGSFINISTVSESTGLTIYENGTNIGKRSYAISSGTSPLGFSVRQYNAGESLSIDIDNIRVRKYTTTPPTVASPTNEEKSQGPVAYWSFDDGQGSVTQDTSLNNNDGTISGAAWQSEDQCISGKCLKFDGINDLISMGGSTNLLRNTTKTTLSVWIKTNAIGALQNAIDISSGTSSSSRAEIQITTTGAIAVGGRAGDADSFQTVTTTTVLSTNRWYFLSAVINYDTDVIEIYFDGILQPTTGTVSFTAISTSNTSPLYVDIGRNANQNVNFLNGFIDGPKIYDYARTAAQIKADYASKSSGSVKGISAQMGTNVKNSDAFSNGLVGYWKMDEAATPAIDTSGNGNSGTWINAPTLASGKFGNGLTFNGSSNYLDINGVTNFAYQNGDKWGISLWFKTTTSYTGINGGKKLFSKATGGATPGYSIAIGQLNSQGYDNKIGFVIDQSPGNNYVLSSNSLPVANDGLWHHIFVSFDATTNTNVGAEIFFDGNDYGYLSSTIAKSGWASSTSITAKIGSGNSAEYFTGTIDETRIYNRALSPKEVRDLYNWAPGPVGYWKMDENTGVSAYDSSSNGLTGTLTSSPSWTNGKYSSAVTFNGSTQYIGTVANPTVLQTTTGTICAWVNPSTITSYHGIFSYQKDYGAGVYGYAFGLRSNGFAFLIGDNTGYYEQFGISTVSTNAWTYGCLAYSPSNIKVYKNGLEIGNYTPTKTAQFYSGNNARIGHLDNDHNYGINGSIDDVRIYNYMRSSKQIVEDMNASHPAGGSPVGSQYLFYRFDEGYGTTTSKDSSPNGLDATLSNTSWSNEGKFGKALSFNGTSAKTTNASFSTPNSITATAWIKHNISTGYKWILGKDTALTIGIGPSTFYGYIHDGTTGGSDGNGWNNCSPTSVSISPNEWHYVALSYNNREQKIYLDGKLLKTCTFSPNGDSDGNVDAGSGNFTVGDLGTRGVYFSGLIDEVKVYNSALTEDEIKLDYNQGSTMVLGAKIEDTNDNPVGYWKLDETNGTTVVNYGSCSTCNGTSASITYGSGKVNGSYDMQPSSTDYWFAPANTALDVDSKFTIEAWGTYDTTSRYGLFANNTVENQFNAYISGTTVAVLGTTLSGGTVTAGQWFHTTVTYDGTSYRLYVNGTLVSADSTTPARDFSGCWVFGHEVDGAGLCSSGFDSGQAWDGKIDEVKIYNYVRSSSQIAADAATDTLNPSLPGAPVAEWKLDENTGANAYDTSGNGYIGTLTGTTWATGKVGSALNFNGTNDVVQTSNPILTGTGDFTIEGWINHTLSSGVDYIAGNYGVSSCSTGIEFYANNGILGTYINGYAGGTTTLNTDTWYHVATTRSSGAVKLYVNGKQDGTGTLASSIGGNCNWAIGNGPNYTSEKFDGKIDHVRVFNYARTPAQIAYDYNRGGPVGYWRMDECQGGMAYDGSGNGNNGTITIGGTGTQTAVGTCTTSGTAWGNGTNGKYNNSLNFDGSDDYVLITEPSNNTFDSDTVSISAWYKSASTDPTQWQKIIGKGPDVTEAFALWINPTGDTAGPNMHISGTNRGIYGTSDIADQNWHHIVGLFDGTSLKVYIDGKQENSGNYPGVVTSNNENISIGKEKSSSTDVYPTNGQIDDVKIFNYALSTDQIKNLYNAGAGIQFAPITGSP